MESATTVQTRHKDESRTGSSGQNIALVGNPNVGKSVIFSILTGRYANISNYPGTTVEVSRGIGKVQKETVTFIDTPGINSFLPGSEDERVTRDIILDGSISAVLQIADAKNLKRALLLALQLSEMQIPFLINLNMMDELSSRGMQIDTDKLSRLIGVPVNETTAIRRKGTERLSRVLAQTKTGRFSMRYPESVEQAISGISALLPQNPPVAKRALATMLLVQDESLKRWVKQNLTDGQIGRLQEIIWELEGSLNNSIIRTINESRFGYINRVYELVISRNSGPKDGMTNRFDALVTHPLWGIPFLLITLFLAYEIVGVLGAGIMVDFFEDTVFGKLINPAAVWLIERLLPLPILQDLLIGPYGVLTMALTYGFAIVLPIVTAFFLVFSFLEDSGYLPRIALMVNRFFKKLGLNGKAVLPMVLGLGCDTMATMAARILETRKERIIVILLLALGVPCSAQLGVILGMTALLPWQATVLWFGVITIVMVLVGTLSAKLIPGVQSDFILELPPLRLPRMSNLVTKTLARIEWYLKEIIPVFIWGTLILFFLDKIHALQWIERLAAPVIQDFLGLPAKATESFLIGFMRRIYSTVWHLFQ